MIYQMLATQLVRKSQKLTRKSRTWGPHSIEYSLMCIRILIVRNEVLKLKGKDINIFSIITIITTNIIFITYTIIITTTTTSIIIITTTLIIITFLLFQLILLLLLPLFITIDIII